MKDRELIGKALRYVKKIWWAYIPALFFFSAQNVFATLSVTSIQKAAIDFFDGGIYEDKFRRIIRLFLIYLILLLLMFLFAAMMDYVNLYLTNGIKKDLLRAYMVFKPGDAGERNKGDMSAKLASDCSCIAVFLTYELGSFLMPVFQIAGCILVLWGYHWQLGAGAVVFAFLPLLYNHLILPKIRDVGKKAQENNGAFMGRLRDNLTMAETVKTYRLEEKELEKNYAVIGLAKRLRLKLLFYKAGRVSVSNICNFLYVSAAVVLGVSLYMKGQLPLSVLTVIPMLAGGVLSGVMEFCDVSFNVQPLLASMKRVFDVIDSSPGTVWDVKEKTEDERTPALEMKEVGFAYENGRGISGVSVAVPPNTYLAVRGEIGSGKSTLMKVLLGQRQKTSGTIYAFGHSQDDMPAEQWLENFTYVEQEQKLFLATVEENILLGEERDEERLRFVLRLTGLDRMLERFPEGIHTMAEERGTNFSGGERQLISFARALYSHAPIMILDEFSSAFDSRTDETAIAALKTVTGDAGSPIRKTAVVISHKADFISAGDMIYEMR